VALDGEVHECVQGTSYVGFRKNYWQKKSDLKKSCLTAEQIRKGERVFLHCFPDCHWAGLRLAADVFVTAGDVHHLMPGKAPPHIPFTYAMPDWANGVLAISKDDITLDKGGRNEKTVSEGEALCQTMLVAYTLLNNRGQKSSAQAQACGLKCLVDNLSGTGWIEARSECVAEYKRLQIATVAAECPKQDPHPEEAPKVSLPPAPPPPPAQNFGRNWCQCKCKNSDGKELYSFVGRSGKADTLRNVD
jgi:hypothetical protein